MAKTAVKASHKVPKPKAPPPVSPSTTLGEYAYAILAKQYHRLVKQEKGVLQDKDPECLHQMRVATRRLRTALQVFGAAIKLPKPAREKHVRNLAQILGQLRDLDVQIAALQTQYRPQLPSSEQKLIDRAVKLLYKQREQVADKVKSALSQLEYQDLKAAYQAWLLQPTYTALAELPLVAILPDLLSPLLSKLLLHPAWLISTADQAIDGGVMLHELRKTCKHARYQTEFFTDLYGESFQIWINELKQIQENLGVVQDTHVLLDILAQKISSNADLPELHQAIQNQQTSAMADWDTVQAKYNSSDFRYSLYQMLLKPNLTPAE